MKKIIFMHVLSILLAFLFTLPIISIAPIELEDGTIYVHPAQLRNENAVPLTDEEYSLLCKVVCLEGGGEGEDLQRAITEVIYNRLKSGLWGKTISEVIYAKDQFSVVPYLWKAAPSDLTKEVVKDVFAGYLTIPENVLYFRTDYYHNWKGCKPSFRIGNVYFSERTR